GANVENMFAFAESYKDDVFRVVLTHNYRSTQPILDISRSLIDRNEERLIHKMQGLTKNLLAKNEKISELKHLPVITPYESQRHEMIDITLKVADLVAQGI